MIFNTAEQIAHLSSRITLYPGDVILTGTPSGVGAETSVFLKRGDQIKITIERHRRSVDADCLKTVSS